MQKTDIEAIKKKLHDYVDATSHTLASIPTHAPALGGGGPLQFDGIIMDRGKGFILAQENPKLFLKEQHRAIDSINCLNGILILIHKRHLFQMYSLIQPYLSEQDNGRYLKYAWTNQEFPNAYFREALDFAALLFKKVPRHFLMNDDEMEVFKNLPAELEIYRGVFDPDFMPGLSWTVNYEKAKWFSKRFVGQSPTELLMLRINGANIEPEKEANPCVFNLTIKKDEVIAFFERENEILIDYEEVKHRISDLTQAA